MPNVMSPKLSTRDNIKLQKAVNKLPATKRKKALDKVRYRVLQKGLEAGDAGDMKTKRSKLSSVAKSYDNSRNAGKRKIKDAVEFHKKIAAKYKKSEADMPRRPAMTEAGSYSHKGWSWRVTEEEAAANRKRKK